MHRKVEPTRISPSALEREMQEQLARPRRKKRRGEKLSVDSSEESLLAQESPEAIPTEASKTRTVSYIPSSYSHLHDMRGMLQLERTKPYRPLQRRPPESTPALTFAPTDEWKHAYNERVPSPDRDDPSPRYLPRIAVQVFKKGKLIRSDVMGIQSETNTHYNAINAHGVMQKVLKKNAVVLHDIPYHRLPRSTRGRRAQVSREFRHTRRQRGRKPGYETRHNLVGPTGTDIESSESSDRRNSSSHEHGHSL